MRPAWRIVLPCRALRGATFEEVEGSGSNDGFYSVSSADGTISWSLSLTASVSHTIVVRGRDDGFLGDALFTLALSVSFCKADMERATEDDVATLNSKLLQAAKDGDTDLACELLQQGADVNARDDDDMTPLHLAAKHGHLDMVKYLLSRNDVDVDARDDRDAPPLFYAAEHGHLDMVKYLSSRGNFNVNMKMGSAGLAALHLAVAFRQLDMMKHFLSYDDVDVNIQVAYSGTTPLYWAAWFGSADMVKYLISRDDIDAARRDYEGDTPLHIAAKPRLIHWMTHARRLEAVKYLLLKIPVNVRNSEDSHTPLDRALERAALASYYNLEEGQLEVPSVEGRHGGVSAFYVKGIRASEAVAATLRALGGVCLTRTDEACGLIMRPLHFTVSVLQNHVGALLAVTATTTHGDSSPVYSLVPDVNGFSVSGSGELTADSGALVEGLVATVSIQATTEGGMQSVAVERVVKVLPLVAARLSDYPSRLTAAAGYAGVAAILSVAAEEGATVSYRFGIGRGAFCAGDFAVKESGAFSDLAAGRRGDIGGDGGVRVGQTRPYSLDGHRAGDDRGAGAV